MRRSAGFPSSEGNNGTHDSRAFDAPPIARSINLIPVALLAALIATQTFTTGMQLEVDARIAAILVAALLYGCRVPFVLVVACAGGVAALVRLLI